jgi:hypothetical protein
MVTRILAPPRVAPRTRAASCSPKLRKQVNYTETEKPVLLRAPALYTLVPLARGPAVLSDQLSEAP